MLFCRRWVCFYVFKEKKLILFVVFCSVCFVFKLWDNNKQNRCISTQNWPHLFWYCCCSCFVKLTCNFTQANKTVQNEFDFVCFEIWIESREKEEKRIKFCATYFLVGLFLGFLHLLLLRKKNKFKWKNFCAQNVCHFTARRLNLGANFKLTPLSIAFVRV